MAEQTRGYKNRWIALAFMGVSLLVISLDNTVLNLALPSISRDLGSSASELQWIIDAYLLSIAGLLLTMGYLGDRFGRKRALTIGLVIFALCSLGAALSRSTVVLIAMRGLMGIGAAIILPATLSTLTATFLDPKERGQAIALWAATFSLGLGIGPLIGGWLLDHFSWSSVFYINLPIIAIGLIGGALYIENSKSTIPRRIDIFGTILSIGAIFSLVFAIIQAGQDGWTATHVLVAFGAAAVLLALFIWWERRTKDAMLPIHFFKNMSFTGANLALTLVSFGLMGSMFFLGQFLQSVQGYSPFEAGVRITPMAVVSFISAALSARIANRIGTKITVALGILIGAGGFYYFTSVANVDVTYGNFLLSMCIIALGIGLTMSPATNSVMGSIPVNQSGVGSAMNNTTRQIGAALGVAVLGTILNSTYLSKIDAVTWPVQLPQQALDGINGSIQGAHIVAQSMQSQSPQLAQMISDQANLAFTAGAQDALLIGAIILTVTAVLTVFILPSRIRGPEPEKGQN